MLVSPTDTVADRRPAIVICPFSDTEQGWDLVEDLSGALWSPPGARTVQIETDAPDRLARELTTQLDQGGARAILLIGRTRRSGDFCIQMRAENRLAEGGRLDPVGPSVARATAPVAEMVEAVREAGLTVAATSDIEDDAGNEILYRLLTALPDGPDSPAIGLLRAPVAAPDAQVQKAVKAAAVAMTRHLGTVARPRVA